MPSADWKCIALALAATTVLLAIALVAVTVNWVLSARSTRAAMTALLATVRIRNTRTPNGRYNKPPPRPPGNLYTEVEVTPLWEVSLFQDYFLSLAPSGDWAIILNPL